MNAVLIGAVCYALNMKSHTATIVRNDSVGVYTEQVVTVPEEVEQAGVKYQVVGVEAGAFRNTYLTQVTLPESVKKIGKLAFESVLNVNGLQVSEKKRYGAQYTGKYGQGYLLYPNDSMQLVLDCSPLARGKIRIPETVTGIAVDAFRDCKLVNAVEIPLSVRAIGLNALQGIPYVHYTGAAQGRPWGATILNGLEFGIYSFANYGRTTLLNCLLTDPETLVIPEGVTYLSSSALEGYEHLREVRLPGSLQEIGSRALAGCRALEKLDLPEGLQYLAQDALDGCVRLDSVRIPAGCQITETQIPLKSQPQFAKGGSVGMRKWLDKNLKVKPDSTQGRPLVQFTVEEDGTVSHVQVLLSSGSREVDEDARRVMEAMPRWVVARDLFDRAVAVTCTVRI